ncbi:hypothetical protein P7C71_g2679, partial [Lecanoromycetidae sp. Uapishka_2]
MPKRSREEDEDGLRSILLAVKALAGDAQLWKALYYERISKWLDDDHLVRRGRATDWKRQYKLRHNWSRGSARVSETQVAEQPSTPPLLLRLRDNTVVTVDDGTLKAWNLKCNEPSDRVMASTALCQSKATSLAIDDNNSLQAHHVDIAIGFDNGSFAIYTLNRNERVFALRYQHPPSRNGGIHAIAYASPYLLTMTGTPLLSLYRFDHDGSDIIKKPIQAPSLLSSLRSHTAYPPISLAIRAASNSIVASIAYAMPTWTFGWSVGLQELRLTADGVILESRMASACSKSFAPPLLHSQLRINGPRIPSITKPTSMSYNHPYLLSAHSDNTLTLYMVTSNAEELSIGAAERLWGHTNGVSAAHVGDRGKAVSVSALGNELRVWELEGGVSSSSTRRRAAAGEASVRVRPERKRRLSSSAVPPASSLQQDFEEAFEETNVTKGWVAFDEEKVVLLREKMQGAQALVVYDFS